MRTVVRGTGEVFITVGLVLLLFAAYQLWWTNVLAGQAAGRNADAIRQSWATEQPPAASTGPPPEGAGIGLMTIPRLGDSVKDTPVLQGVSLDVLAQGIGHYPDSAMPGQVGNFAVAGHRATNGEPLRDIDTLRPGDLVYMQTADTWYIYKLFDDMIVDPHASWVVSPEPSQGFPAKLLTLTTCNPRWASTERWVWWGELVATKPKSEGTPSMEVSS